MDQKRQHQRTMSERESDDAQNIILFYLIYVIHKKFELNICWFHTHIILLPGWNWDAPKSDEPFEVSHVDYVKPLILTFLWVEFDINHLLERVLRGEPSSALFLPVHGYSTQASSCVWMLPTCNYRGFLSIFTQQLQVSRQFNMSVFQVLRRRMRLHTDDDVVFSCRQAGLCRHSSQLNISTTDLERGKTDTKHRADMDAPWVKVEKKKTRAFNSSTNWTVILQILCSLKPLRQSLFLWGSLIFNMNR